MAETYPKISQTHRTLVGLTYAHTDTHGMTINLVPSFAATKVAGPVKGQLVSGQSRIYGPNWKKRFILPQ